jgi:general secretion pathway protein G
MMLRQWPPTPRVLRRNERAALVSRASGFTLLELMIVITIIMILVGIAAVRYDKSVRRAKETALKSDLQSMRQAIEQYTLDKQAPPQSLEDLTSGQYKYLREIPTDPITRQKDWQLVFEDVVLSPEQTTAGVTDVHSASGQISLEGTPYNSW